MIELNLLPDVKQEYLKAQRTQRLVATTALLVSLAAVALLLSLLGIGSLQKKHLSDLTKNINQESSQLQQEPDINKILTVQNQLNSLTSLHAGEPNMPALFSYLNEVTPAKVAITNFTIDFTQQTTVITGTSDSLSSVNQYIDTLKLTTYTGDTNSSNPLPAFNNVVLNSFSLNTNSTDPSQAANYTINLSYDKNIFDVTQSVNLTVPNTTTTRINESQPSALFKNAPASSTGAGSH